MVSSGLIIIVILLAFSFDFINGFHDAANSIATIIATGVLKPAQAVIWAAFFNFIAFLFFHLTVATTIGTGLVDSQLVNASMLLAALSGAIIWNLLTWYIGLPSSSSHALVGGLIGAAVAGNGFAVLNFTGIGKVLIAIIISPLLGIGLGFLLMRFAQAIYGWRRCACPEHWVRYLQLLTSALLSLGHGGNDAQKTMGIIAILLFSGGFLGSQFYIPHWVVLSCNLVMALGTLCGGWRIVDTLGKKITPLNTVSGACAETAGAMVLFIANSLGIPISTTHTMTGAVTGVGLRHPTKTSNWSLLRKIVCAWLLTIPIAALCAASIFSGCRYLFGIA